MANEGGSCATSIPEMDAEGWLAAIVESSDDAIVGESLSGIITSWNSGAQRIFGYTADEVIGKPITALVWPGDEDEIESLLRRLRSGERVDHFQTIRRHKNGSKIIVSLSLSPIRDHNKRVIGIAKIARDITDRVALQESLTATAKQVRLLTEREALSRAHAIAERRFREHIEHAPDGILQVDHDGTITIANATVEKMFGYSREELVGMKVDQLVPENSRAAHEAHRRSFAETGVTRPMGAGLELYAQRKDGSRFPVEISLSPAKENGHVHITAVIRDVTDRKRNEQHMRTLQETYMAELETRKLEAERLNRVKSEFMAGITHELRTPLHTIIGFSDLLMEELEGPLNDTQRGFVDQIRRDSDHLLGLINDVLDLSRIESGGLHLQTESLAIADIVANSIGSIQPQAQTKGIAIQGVIPDGLRVRADPMRLRQVLFNLLSNAVKFTPQDGSIRVSASVSHGLVRVTVADSGIGIATDEQERIFDRFYQVGYTTGGAGLGLAICKQLVEMQGGTIEVESEPGKGSSFYFTLQEAV